MTILPTLSMRLMRRRILPVVLSIGAEAVPSCKGGDVAGGNPTIALAAQSVTLTATAQGANPAAQTVAVTNGGTGSLIRVSGTPSYQTGQTPGGPAATPGQTTTPAH